MYNGHEIAVIIAAAGQGKRLGADVPKQFLKIAGEPILVKTVRAFSNNESVDSVFIVTGTDYIGHCEQLVKEYGLEKVAAVVEGGKERQDSVYSALQQISSRCPDTEYVLVHDAARPFVNQETIDNVIAASVERSLAFCACSCSSNRR